MPILCQQISCGASQELIIRQAGLTALQFPLLAGRVLQPMLKYRKSISDKIE
jgi:hypothetical protein